MTDLLDLLSTLDPAPGPARYDDATVDRNVAAILAGPAARPATVPPVRPPALGRIATGSARRRVAGRPALAGLVVAAVLALVATSVAVTQHWIRPLGGVPATVAPTAAVLFGSDVDASTVRSRLVGAGPTALTLWSATSPALGHCLAVTASGGAWAATAAPDAGWRPLQSGAACLDDRVSVVTAGAGLVARFVSGTTPAEEVFAGSVALPTSTPAADLVTSVDLGAADGTVTPAAVGDGLFLTTPVTVGGCPTVVARNGVGTVLSTDVLAPGCAGAAAPVASVTSGSDAADIHLDNNLYADGMSSGLSALTRRDPSSAGVDTDGMTLLTLSVQFFDACSSPPDAAGRVPFPDPCMVQRIAIPTDVDLQLTYGADHAPAQRVDGRGGPGDDLTSPPTPGYVGGKVFGVLVYRSFLVPDDQLGLLTARWAGDSVHAPLVMDGVQRALG